MRRLEKINGWGLPLDFFFSDFSHRETGAIRICMRPPHLKNGLR